MPAQSGPTDPPLGTTQVGVTADSTPAELAPLYLLGQVIREPCFDTLRTKEQLGYAVSSGGTNTHGVLGFILLVQSSSHPPAHLDSRIEAFLASFDEVRSIPPLPPGYLWRQTSESSRASNVYLSSATVARSESLAHACIFTCTVAYISCRESLFPRDLSRRRRLRH